MENFIYLRSIDIILTRQNVVVQNISRINSALRVTTLSLGVARTGTGRWIVDHGRIDLRSLRTVRVILL